MVKTVPIGNSGSLTAGGSSPNPIPLAGFGNYNGGDGG
jgi:hypothetical protein